MRCFISTRLRPNQSPESVARQNIGPRGRCRVFTHGGTRAIRIKPVSTHAMLDRNRPPVQDMLHVSTTLFARPGMCGCLFTEMARVPVRQPALPRLKLARWNLAQAGRYGWCGVNNTRKIAGVRGCVGLLIHGALYILLAFKINIF